MGGTLEKNEVVPHPGRTLINIHKGWQHAAHRMSGPKREQAQIARCTKQNMAFKLNKQLHLLTARNSSLSPMDILPASREQEPPKDRVARYNT